MNLHLFFGIAGVLPKLLARLGVEARQTPEAKFAAAVDRFQPMLLNCRTEGAAWRKHGVTRDRVIARNSYIAEGSAALWDYAQKMIEETVAAGHLEK